MLVKKHFALPDGESVKMFDNVSAANYESCSGFPQAEGKDNTAHSTTQEAVILFRNEDSCFDLVGGRLNKT